MQAKPLSYNIPTILVVFGATGDLMERKITPALYHLFEKDKLPSRFHVVGFSRQALSKKEFDQKISQTLKARKRIPASSYKAFSRIFSYCPGEFGNQGDYAVLAQKIKEIDDSWGVCCNKLFYLAVPPQFYETIFKNLAKSGLTNPCSGEEGWSRVLVEKPFGKNAKTAERLDRMLGKLFKEEQIYRIDHYLAKDMIQNILNFRFANNLFEHSWDKRSIEKIHIRIWEVLGVENRGSFYDALGALQDVGQNHMLQMLALTAMERPGSFDADIIRSSRARVLEKLILPSKQDLKRTSFRAQYKGYRKIAGVNAHSERETFFRIQAFLSSPRFKGVPIILESGKRMPTARKEIEVTFRHPEPCFCAPEDKGHYVNTLIISLEPEEAITIHFWSKKPGLDSGMERREFNFLLRKKGIKEDRHGEYEKLLLDAIQGDQTLFVSTKEVMAMWRFIDPIVKAWQKNVVPLFFYEPGTEPETKA